MNIYRSKKILFSNGTVNSPQTEWTALLTLFRPGVNTALEVKSFRHDA